VSSRPAFRKVIVVTLFAVFVFGLRSLIPLAQQRNVGSASGPVKQVNFVEDIQPIFQENCYKCHGPNAQLSGLRLDLKQSALAGGIQGKDILPGKAFESALYARVAGLGGVSRMPMGGKPLPDTQIELIRLWIDQGADWPDEVAYKPVEVKKHWAFLAPQRPPLPRVKNSTWTQNPIDDFVLSRLEREGLSPSRPANRVTLLRRLSLDLIGLPPMREEVDAFLADKSKNAYEKQVESAFAFTPLRRAMGPDVARRGALRRLQRLRK